MVQYPLIMQKYAIVQILGKQYKVSEGDKLSLDRVPHDEGKKFDITEVLAVHDGKSLKIGTPIIEKAVVSFKVLTVEKSKKIRVAKFRAKSRYRNVRGHRQFINTVEVLSIK